MYPNQSPKASFMKTLATPMGFNSQRRQPKPKTVAIDSSAYQNNPNNPALSVFSASNSATAPVATPAPSTAMKSQPAQNYMSSLSKDSLAGLSTGLQNLSTGLGNLQTNTPAAPARDPYREAFDTYMASLTPGDDITRAQKALSDFDIQALKDEEAALNRGETIGFARGEAERTNRNNAIERMARASSLEALSGVYKTRTEGSKARLDFEKSLMDKKEPSITEKYGSGAIGEYNFAKEQGYTGSFQDYQNEDANRKAKASGSGSEYTNYEAKNKAAQKAASAKLGTWLSGVVGEDQRVSPTDYKKAKAAWVADGYSGKDFDDIFNGFVNPAFAPDYTN